MTREDSWIEPTQANELQHVPYVIFEKRTILSLLRYSASKLVRSQRRLKMYLHTIVNIRTYLQVVHSKEHYNADPFFAFCLGTIERHGGCFLRSGTFSDLGTKRASARTVVTNGPGMRCSVVLPDRLLNIVSKSIEIAISGFDIYVVCIYRLHSALHPLASPHFLH